MKENVALLGDSDHNNADRWWRKNNKGLDLKKSLS